MDKDELLRQVQSLFQRWEGGLDHMDGDEYERACEEWERVKQLVDDHLASPKEDANGR